MEHPDQAAHRQNVDRLVEAFMVLLDGKPMADGIATAASLLGRFAMCGSEEVHSIAVEITERLLAHIKEFKDFSE